MRQNKEESNNQVYKKEKRRSVAKKTGKCSYCPYHNGENYGMKRYGKHGPKKKRTFKD